jgi:death on curing protein
VSKPVWIKKKALLLAHAQTVARQGGLGGLRDEGLLDSALARPKNLYAYEGIVDVRRLAVSYAVGILRNHPFADGNKRAGFIALGMFLALNGFDLPAEVEEEGRTFFAAASGDISEEELNAWVLKNAVAQLET